MIFNSLFEMSSKKAVSAPLCSASLLMDTDQDTLPHGKDIFYS